VLKILWKNEKYENIELRLKSVLYFSHYLSVIEENRNEGED
jgi:hypothetical protein